MHDRGEDVPILIIYLSFRKWIWHWTRKSMDVMCLPCCPATRLRRSAMLALTWYGSWLHHGLTLWIALTSSSLAENVHQACWCSQTLQQIQRLFRIPKAYWSRHEQPCLRAYQQCSWFPIPYHFEHAWLRAWKVKHKTRRHLIWKMTKLLYIDTRVMVIFALSYHSTSRIKRKWYNWHVSSPMYWVDWP